MTAVLLALSLVLGARQAPPAETGSERPGVTRQVIAEVRVHGNQVTPDEEVIRLADVAVGVPFDERLVAAIGTRLRGTGRFRDVEVLKRFRSIADSSEILLIIVVDEGPVRVEATDEPGMPVRVVKRRGPSNLMVLPVLSMEDGYGATYGARIATAGVGGRRGRVSFPLTWGGSKRVAVEYDRPFSRGPVSRMVVGTGIERRRNPAFDLDDDRRTVWGRAERAIGPVRVGAGMRWDRVSFQSLDDDLRSSGVDVTFDTRVDPAFPRDAVYASAAWTRLDLSSREPIYRLKTEARGYLGLVGQSVLVLRVLRDGADGPLPPYLQPLLGGWSSLRGFEAGTFVGDTLVAGSVELRLPFSSPLRVAKTGLSVFMDAGKAYSRPVVFRDVSAHEGAGIAAWITVAAFRLEIAVAHGSRASTRVNFLGGVGF